MPNRRNSLTNRRSSLMDKTPSLRLTKLQEKWINEPIPFIPGMDLRLANLLEKQGINRVIDLLNCCPSVIFCVDCGREDCELVRLRGIAKIGDVYVDLIYNVLEGIGFRRSEIKEVKS